MNQLTNQTVYDVLAEHQQSEDWEHHPLVQELHRWWILLDGKFKLNIPTFALRVDRLDWFVLGHHRRGHNSFGLRHEVALNTLHLTSRPKWQVIGTLFHEMLHVWQEEYGTPSIYYHHNQEFRDKASTYGLIVDRRGVTEYISGSFLALIAEHQIEIPDGPQKLPTHRTSENGVGSSKLKKWSCGCERPVNVRVAVTDFQAMCLKCRTLFTRQA